MTHVLSILVVGAGQAAAVAVAALRDQGYEGRITVVGREVHPPYERPPLSKAVLAAIDTDEPVIAVQAPDFFATRNVDLRLGVEVLSLEPGSRRAVLSDGSVVEYDRCLLATGGSARVLPSFPPDLPQVHYLRTLDDARALRAKLPGCERVVVIGGGFLGLEIASTARALGVAVSVIETAPRVLARAVPETFSSWLQGRAALSGVTLYMGQAITQVLRPDALDAPVVITLADGTELTAKVVVVAVGLMPDVQLACQAGLSIDSGNGGIAVDSQCRTSDAFIYAAGDCASQTRSGVSGAVRLESWQNANEQARIAATSMLNQDASPAAYPWFWTDQFGCNVQMLGLPQAGLEYITRGDTDAENAAPRFLMLGLRDGKPYHALAVNGAADLRCVRPLLERMSSIDVARFIDKSITLREFAKTTLASANSPVSN